MKGGIMSSILLNMDTGNKKARLDAPKWGMD